MFKEVIYYAQNYAHHYCNYATIYVSFIIFNDYISIVSLQPVVFYIMLMLQRSYILHIMLNIILMRKLEPAFAPSWHGYYITNIDCYITTDDQNVYKSTDNNFQ